MAADVVHTVLVFEGQGARTIEATAAADGSAAPLDLTTLPPVDAQSAIVRHQVARAERLLATLHSAAPGTGATRSDGPPPDNARSAGDGASPPPPHRPPAGGAVGAGERAGNDIVDGARVGVAAPRRDGGPGAARPGRRSSAGGGDGRVGVAVLGQSLGEISALVVAGALALDDALEVVRLRAELPAKLLDEREWTMASLTRVRRDAAVGAAEGLPLWIVGDNAPADCIVVGESAAFQRFADELRLNATTYRELPVVQPYHTPAMAPVAAAMAEALADMPFADPAVPMLSPTGPRTITDADAARAVLVDALVSPVAWSSALTQAAARWPDARWRECGPSASLHRFVWKNKLDLDWSEA